MADREPPAADRAATEAPLMGRTAGRPRPGTTIPKFLARTICRSPTSRVLDPRCRASLMAWWVTLSRKSSASWRTCSSALASIP